MNAISVNQLSKHYSVREIKTTTIKELVLKRLLRPAERTEVCALRDISFAVQKGASLGIIGPNGSGKSTLLKCLAGITQPTSGTIEVQGKIASLLELGAGFHPELSGMENIYLNGSLLGMSKSDIDAQLSNIIRFAELEDFIYAPVKHYSSGMHVRLGFSVAAHINPDVFLIDEVLAVGDVYFQVKSFEKIKEFKTQGKTILFVTHNFEQAEMICDEILWLDKGSIHARGLASEIIFQYGQQFYRDYLATHPRKFDAQLSIFFPHSRMGSGEALIEMVKIKNGAGEEVRYISTDEPLVVEAHINTSRVLPDVNCFIGLAREDGLPITLINSHDQGISFPPLSGSVVITARFDPLPLNEGRYILTVAIAPVDEPLNPYDLHLRLYRFTVKTSPSRPLGRAAVMVPARFELVKSG
jgi:lipopolysaccharide transport system ATP-binding protein